MAYNIFNPGFNYRVKIVLKRLYKSNFEYRSLLAFLGLVIRKFLRKRSCTGLMFFLGPFGSAINKFLPVHLFKTSLG
jgi:hypothetical protein